MKKTIVTLAMMIILLTTAFAGDEKVKPEVLKAFKNSFMNAAYVTWTVDDDYYKAAFTLNGNWMFAFYNATGVLLGLKRYISSTQLPYFLQNSRKKNYADYWITDLLEVSTEKGFSYYITLEDADYKIILESRNGSDWKLFHKHEKYQKEFELQKANKSLITEFLKSK